MEHIAIAITIKTPDGKDVLALAEADTYLPVQLDSNANDEAELIKARVRAMMSTLEQRCYERIDELGRLGETA
jgi:hypothetical protein